MDANVPTNPNRPEDLSCTNYTVSKAVTGIRKFLKTKRFLRAWNYIYKVCTIHQIYVYHMNGCKYKKYLVLYIVSYFHLI